MYRTDGPEMGGERAAGMCLLIFKGTQEATYTHTQSRDGGARTWMEWDMREMAHTGSEGEWLDGMSDAVLISE